MGYHAYDAINHYWATQDEIDERFRSENPLWSDWKWTDWDSFDEEWACYDPEDEFGKGAA